jgi:hypothetical protein
VHWLLYVFGGLVAVLLLLTLLGLFVPKSHVATRSAIFHQPINHVFEVLSGPPSWRTDLKSYEPLPSQNGVARWRETWKVGRTVTMERDIFEPPYRIRTRIADKNRPFTGAWMQELRETPGGTEVRITETGEIYNPLFRFLARFVFGYHRSMENYLSDLGQALEEQVEIRP